MAVVLGPYNLSTKAMIIEDAVNSYKDVMFYNSAGSFELIQNGNQIIIPSFDDFKNIARKEHIHLLCPSMEMCKKIEALLRKNKLKVITKKESYII